MDTEVISTTAQVCTNLPEAIVGIVGMIVMGVSAIVNFIPAPDTITNGFFKAVSRFLHFIAFDITTAVRK